MNKILKKLISIFVIVCTISNIAYAVPRPAGAKGTVAGSGTAEEPYRLVLGEEIIDMYYDEETTRYIYFEFTGGSYNSAAYTLEHNPDKQRIRLCLLGTGEEYTKVKAEEGINYLQAGAESLKVSTEEDSGELYNPFYRITSTEKFNATRNDGKSVKLGHSVDLGNVHNEKENSLNESEYAVAYVFSKSNLPYNTAYTITDDQKEHGKISYKIYNSNDRVDYTAYGDFEGTSTIKERVKETTSAETNNYIDRSYSGFGTVEVVYTFRGVSSEVSDSSEETAGEIEKLLSKVFVAIGDLFVRISGIGGKDGESYITIDALVFNEYPNTIVDFWGDTGYTNEIAKGVIETWFNIFKAWAIIIYIILLVYIGIKTMLFGGTSEHKKIKGMLEGWLEGLLLLFFLPFLFKYLIVINDAFVDILRVNSKYSIHAYYTFENMYETLGGQEDGEDSTTTILERLKNAKKFLSKDSSALEKDLQNVEKELQKLIEDLENTNFFEYLDESIINFNLKNARDNLEEHIDKKHLKVTINGVEKTSGDIDADLTEIIVNFYTSEENREEFVKNKDIEKAIKNNEELNALIDEYINSLEITSTDSTTVTDREKSKLKDYVATLAKRIVPTKCSEIIEANLEAQKQELRDKMAEIQEKIAEIDTVILKIENSEADLMGAMRRKAGATWRFLYVAVWYVLLFELIILLILYYKRLFMLMVLIAVFPLVTVAYAYERSKGGKAGIFKNWVQEYIINVFIQTAHAILYVTLVEAGYSIYIADNDNWLIFILAVAGLIIIEPIFKHIIGLQGSTVTELGKYGAKAAGALVAAKAVASTWAHTMKDLENIENSSQNKEKEIKDKQDKKDSRTDTKRLERDNRVRNDKRKTEEEKQEQLRKNKEKDEKEDKAKEKQRKDAANRRRRRKRNQMRARLLKNASATLGTVAAGIAAGGDMQDFVAAAGIANALSGTNQPEVEVTDEAAKLEKQRRDAEKAEKEAKKANKKQGEVPTPEVTPEENGAGGAGAGAGGGANRPNPEDIKEEDRLSVKNPKLADAFAQRLEEEKVFINKKYNFKEENSK